MHGISSRTSCTGESHARPTYEESNEDNVTDASLHPKADAQARPGETYFTSASVCLNVSLYSFWLIKSLTSCEKCQKADALSVIPWSNSPV